MNFSGDYLFRADRLKVWQALNDTGVLKSAIPGCDRIEWLGDAQLEIEVKVNLGVTQPTFKGELELLNVEPASRYTLAGRGKGGLLGLAHGEADISLLDRAGGTHLRFDASGGGSGQLMKLGAAVIGGRAQSIIDGFFSRIGEASGIAVSPIDEE